MQSLRYYRELIQKIDAFTESINSTYGNQLHCREGCSSCCILESIMPVELVPIVQWYVTQPESIKTIIKQVISSNLKLKIFFILMFFYN